MIRPEFLFYIYCRVDIFLFSAKIKGKSNNIKEKIKDTPMSSSQKIVKNTTYLTSAFVVQKILAFVYFTILARIIGVENVGKYSFALSYTLIWAVFMDLGLSIALVRELSQKLIDIRDYFKSLFLFKVLASFSVYAILFLTIYFADYDASSRALLYWAGIVMVVDSFAQLFYAILRSQQLIKYEAVGVILNQFTIMVIGMVSVLFWPDKLYLLLVAFLAGAIMNNIVSLYGLKKNNLLAWQRAEQGHLFLWRKLFLFTWPFALATIFTRVYSYLDSVLLKYLVDDRAVGFYSVAYKIPFALQFIPIAFGAAIYPAMSALFGKDNDRLRRILNYSLFYLLLLVLPMLTGIWALAPEIIEKFYGLDYLPAISILRVLVLGLFFIFVNYPLTTVISSIGQQKYNTLFIAITLVINVILNLILIPFMGPQGAALAFLASHGSLFLMAFVFIRKKLAFEAKKFVFNFIKVGIVSLIMGALVLFLKSYLYWVLTIPLGGIVYILLLLVFRVIKLNDFNKILALLRNKSLEAVE